MYSAVHHVIQYWPIRGRHCPPIREGPDGFVYVRDSHEIWGSSNRPSCLSIHTQNYNSDTMTTCFTIFNVMCKFFFELTHRCCMSYAVIGILGMTILINVTLLPCTMNKEKIKIYQQFRTYFYEIIDHIVCIAWHWSPRSMLNIRNCEEAQYWWQHSLTF